MPFITDAVVVMWIVTAIIAIIAFLATRNLRTVPKGAQKAAEALVEFVNGMLKDKVGARYKTFAPFICSLLVFLALSNIIAIFNVIPSGIGFSLEPPTKNFNVTISLAVFAIVYAVYMELKFKGFKGWLRGFYKPSPIYGFVRVLDLVVRPMSLCLRLFGNVLGSYIAVALAYTAVPLFLPVLVSMYFDLFDGVLQAYVFIFLTTMYLSEAAETPEEV